MKIDNTTIFINVCHYTCVRFFNNYFVFQNHMMNMNYFDVVLAKCVLIEC